MLLCGGRRTRDGVSVYFCPSQCVVGAVGAVG